MRISSVSLTPENKSRLVALDRTLFPADSPYPITKGYWWIITDKGQDVGFAGIKELPDHCAFLCRVGVLKAYSRKGLHRRLIRLRLAKAKQLGIKTVITYTVTHNPKSSNNLIKTGFTLYTPEYRYAGAVLYWRKEL